jgi:hypothetical protein
LEVVSDTRILFRPTKNTLDKWAQGEIINQVVQEELEKNPEIVALEVDFVLLHLLELLQLLVFLLLFLFLPYPFCCNPLQRLLIPILNPLLPTHLCKFIPANQLLFCLCIPFFFLSFSLPQDLFLLGDLVAGFRRMETCDKEFLLEKSFLLDIVEDRHPVFIGFLE